MSKTRLKPAAKFLIMIALAASLILSFIYLRPLIIPEGDKAQSVAGLMSGSNSPSTGNKCIEVGVVTWGGYAGGQYWNNGFKDNPGSKYRKDGICVNFTVMDDFAASRAAFKSGKMDLMWVTIDAFPTESGSFGEPVKFLFQADWSRGGDAIVATAGINQVGDLAGKKIAVAEATPSHTFLLWMLDMSGLSIMDVNVVKVSSAIDAAAAFKAGKVDAAVVWSPDDAACVSAIANSKILVNTKQATHIIADGFMVKESVYNAKKDQLKKLVEGWLNGSAEINESEPAKAVAAKILASGFTGVDEAFTKSAINNTRLATLGDNLDFFGINNSYSGVTGKNLYEKMTVVYSKLNLSDNAPSWDKVVDLDFIRSLNVQGGTSEKKVEFAAPTKAVSTSKAIASKPVRVSFASGKSQLDDNATSIIDFMFVEQVKAFPSSRIRIEGNTDHTGAVEANRRISKERAEAVVNYLVSQHGMDRNRFVVVGNGPDKPLCSEDTPICLAKNRRTDFQILEE
jgi:NitT/TauT family transport system substrate-binding protein